MQFMLLVHLAVCIMVNIENKASQSLQLKVSRRPNVDIQHLWSDLAQPALQFSSHTTSVSILHNYVRTTS